jgi:D-glycerate 3-kinase
LQLSTSIITILQHEIESRGLPEDFMVTVVKWYLPLAQQIQRASQQQVGTFMVSFNGAQGSGKSTITAFLRLILIHQFGLNTVEVSIDDFYLTRAKRIELSSTLHPLLITRGVPGTHDVELAQKTLACLKNCDQEHPCAVPVFDKAADDRSVKSDWPLVRQQIDIILFEGWCNHAPVQSEQQLEQPINDLERVEDEHGVWRHYANQQLKIYHEKLFTQAGFFIFLQVPSYEKVYEWRGLQESKLATANKDNKAGVMNESELKRFIQHYERITRQCLKELPSRADVVIRLDDDHIIQQMEIKSKETNNV